MSLTSKATSSKHFGEINEQDAPESNKAKTFLSANDIVPEMTSVRFSASVLFITFIRPPL
ncbi:hypothetical protein GCM10007928_52150 [Sulfitobacter porphyrae]|nr:hypothetical protein GCM10007928_52150 [Sulfitobacter porphyrae]